MKRIPFIDSSNYTEGFSESITLFIIAGILTSMLMIFSYAARQQQEFRQFASSPYSDCRSSGNQCIPPAQCITNDGLDFYCSTPNPTVSQEQCSGGSADGCVGQAVGFTFSIGNQCLSCFRTTGQLCGRQFVTCINSPTPTKPDSGYCGVGSAEGCIGESVGHLFSVGTNQCMACFRTSGQLCGRNYATCVSSPTPSQMPTNTPTATQIPTSTTTNTPRPSPTPFPSTTPTLRPSSTPISSRTPTPIPTKTPTPFPTNTPTRIPTLIPTLSPPTTIPSGGDIHASVLNSAQKTLDTCNPDKSGYINQCSVSPNKYWCATLASDALIQNGVDITRTNYGANLRDTFRQNNALLPPKAAGQVQPGDIVFFQNAALSPDQPGYNHVAVVQSVKTYTDTATGKTVGVITYVQANAKTKTDSISIVDGVPSNKDSLYVTGFGDPAVLQQNVNNKK